MKVALRAARRCPASSRSRTRWARVRAPGSSSTVRTTRDRFYTAFEEQVNVDATSADVSEEDAAKLKERRTPYREGLHGRHTYHQETPVRGTSRCASNHSNKHAVPQPILHRRYHHIWKPFALRTPEPLLLCSDRSSTRWRWLARHQPSAPVGFRPEMSSIGLVGTSAGELHV